jgi:hypothetical protein
MDHSQRPIDNIQNHSDYQRVRPVRSYTVNQLRSGKQAVDLSANTNINTADLKSNPRQLNNLIAYISTRLGISSSTAFMSFRTLLQYSPNRSEFTLAELTNHIANITKNPDDISLDSNNQLSDPKKANNLNQTTTNNTIKSLNDAQASKLAQPSGELNFKTTDKFVSNKAGFRPEAKASLISSSKFSKEVLSNKNFASWLVNNPSAMLLMSKKPAFLNFYTAMTNRQVLKDISPLMLSYLVAIAAQVLKLKQLKNNSTDYDIERIKAQRDNKLVTQQTVNQANKVKAVSDGVYTELTSSAKNFMLEAERFAEEERAMFSSMQKKIERRVKNYFKK